MTTRHHTAVRACILVLLLAAGGYWLWPNPHAMAQAGVTQPQVNPPQANPLFPPEMNATAYAKGDVIGDLGGVKVRIPAHFANYVEYDGDPGFGEKRQGSAPQRNFESKLMSFGFEVRFPDMAGRTSPELWKDHKRKWQPDSYWMSAGVTTGQHYYGDGYLDKFINATLKFKADERFPSLKFDEYEKLPKPEFGLTAYASPGIDPKTKKPWREDQDAKDLFVLRDAGGRVVTAIACANRSRNPTCQHDFSMEPTMKAAITVRYRRGMLPQWKEIQTNVSQLIESFALKAEPAQPVQPPPSR
jgi:hypothetical protein